MNITFLTIRQPPYYRTLYNNKQHIYLPKNFNYVGPGTEINELGCHCYNSSKRNCRISQITFFLIIINIIWLCLQTTLKYLEMN